MSELDSKSAWRIALVGVAGALAGGFLGSGLGVLGSVWVADRTHEHDLGDRALEHRIAAYQDVIATVDAVGARIDDMTTIRLEAEQRTGPEVLARSRRLLRLQGRIGVPFARLAVFGSPEVVALGETLRAEVVDAITAAVLADATRTDKRYKELNDQQDDVRRAEDIFIAAVRDDVQ